MGVMLACLFRALKAGMVSHCEHDGCEPMVAAGVTGILLLISVVFTLTATTKVNTCSLF